MKRLTVFLLCALILVIGWNANMATSDPPNRTFGPEWTKDGDIYNRKLEVPVLHHAGGNLSVYSIPLENDKIDILETDNNEGFELRSNPYVTFEVIKNEQGKPWNMKVKLLNYTYLDLDGDGIIDVFPAGVCGDKKNHLIVFEGRFIEVTVKESKRMWRFAPNEKPRCNAVDNDIVYVLDGGKWKRESGGIPKAPKLPE